MLQKMGDVGTKLVDFNAIYDTNVHTCKLKYKCGGIFGK